MDEVGRAALPTSARDRARLGGAMLRPDGIYYVTSDPPSRWS